MIVYEVSPAVASVSVNATASVSKKNYMQVNIYLDKTAKKKQNRHIEFLSVFNYSKLQPEPVLWLKIEWKKAHLGENTFKGE